MASRLNCSQGGSRDLIHSSIAASLYWESADQVADSGLLCQDFAVHQSEAKGTCNKIFSFLHNTVRSLCLKSLNPPFQVLPSCTDENSEV
jgi:hypothetical protein